MIAVIQHEQEFADQIADRAHIAEMEVDPQGPVFQTIGLRSDLALWLEMLPPLALNGTNHYITAEYDTIASAVDHLATWLPIFLQLRVKIFFCFNPNYTMTPTRNCIQQVHGNMLLWEKQIGKWYKLFQGSQTTTAGLHREPNPKVSRNQASIDAVQATEEAGCHYCSPPQSGHWNSCCSYATNAEKWFETCVEMYKICTRTAHWTQHHGWISSWLFRTCHKVLEHTVIMDESLVCQYDPLGKHPWREWLQKEEPRQIKAPRARGTGKVLIVTFCTQRTQLLQVLSQNCQGSKFCANL